DSSKAGAIYAELADNAAKKRDYEAVISFLEKKRAGNDENLTNNEWFSIGKAYYFTGQSRLVSANEIAEELKKKKKKTSPELEDKRRAADSLFVLADTAFLNLVKLNPSWPIGHAWRGRTNAMMDPEAKTDSTKQHFEMVLELIKPEERAGSYKNYALEALEYLGYYYVVRKEEALAKEQWLKVKELDPGNKK